MQTWQTFSTYTNAVSDFPRKNNGFKANCALKIRDKSDKVYECMLALRHKFAIWFIQYTPFERRRRKKVGRTTGEFHERPAPSSVENYVASPSIMKRPLIMKATEGVPSGGITIFHAYCLTAERLQAPFCLPRYQPYPVCPIYPLPVSTPFRTLSAHIDPFFALSHSCLAIFAILGASRLPLRRQREISSCLCIKRKRNCWKQKTKI